MVQFVIRLSERSLDIAPPWLVAEFAVKRQSVISGLLLQLAIAPPSIEELSVKMQLLIVASVWAELFIAPPRLAAELARKLQLEIVGELNVFPIAPPLAA